MAHKLLNKIPVVPFHGLFILRGYILLKKIVLTIYFLLYKKIWHNKLNSKIYY